MTTSPHHRTSKRRHQHGASARELSRKADELLHHMPLQRRRRVQKALHSHVVGAMLDELFRSVVQPELDLLNEKYSPEQIEATGVFG